MTDFDDCSSRWRAAVLRRIAHALTGAIIAFPIGTACSSSDDDGSGEKEGTGARDGGGQEDDGTGGGLIFGNGSGGQGAGADGGVVAPNACNDNSDEQGCVAERFAGENIPLDIYVMFDQSCSMSCPVERQGPGQCCIGSPNARIDQVRSAVTQFLEDRQNAGIGVGIGYFGYMNSGSTSCDPAEYSDPAVTVGSLPDNTDYLLRSLNSVQPTGETPTGAAIRGACTYAAQWQTLSGHAVIVLLVTDGVPEAPTTAQRGGCEPTLPDAVQAASTCAGFDPPLPVYVLGVGAALDNLNQIAAAGGTERAFLVQADRGGNVSEGVLQALRDIRDLAAIPCELKIPPAPAGSTLSLDRVNVGYCNPDGESETFVYVESPDQCDQAQNGWHYDDPISPQHIELCESSCGRVSGPGGSLFMSVGCRRVDGPIQ